MSASREKKRRQEQAAAPAAEGQAKKGMSKNTKTALSIVIAVAVVAILVFFALITTGFFESHTTAAVVSGHKLSAAEVNYWLADTYSTEQSKMGYLVDEELPLNEQAYPEEGFENWYDYMLDLALTNAAKTYTTYDEAVASGFTLSEESQASLDAQIQTLDMYASLYGFPNATAFLSAQYGAGCTASNYEHYMTVNMIAQAYTAANFAEKEYTQEELDAFYADNAAKIDLVSYRRFSMAAEKVEGEDGTETVTEETLAAAEEKAIAMADASKGNEEKFLELAKENNNAADPEAYDADVSTQAPDTTVESAPEAYREWLSTEGLSFGDVYVVESASGNGFDVLFYQGAVDMSMKLPSVRHVLVSANSSAEDGMTMEEAKAEAEHVLEEYKAGEQTEEAFAALASSHSSDTGSTGNGGLYENIVPNQMVQAFNDWCFAEHEVGDTGIVETEYGYHVMYFCGLSEGDFKSVATETALRNSEYEAWEESIDAAASHELVNSKYINII